MKIGRILQKLDNVIEDIENIKVDLKQLDKRVTVQETTVKAEKA